MLQEDRLIYSILDIYHSIKEDDGSKGIKKFINNIKKKKLMKKLKDIVNNLPDSNLKLTTNSLIEFVSYILYTSELTSFGSIKKIIVKSSTNTRNIYILSILTADYTYGIKLDADNLFMNIDIKMLGQANNITSNTKVERLDTDGNNNTFNSNALKYLNRVLLGDISEYINTYIIEKGD